MFIKMFDWLSENGNLREHIGWKLIRVENWLVIWDFSSFYASIYLYSKDVVGSGLHLGLGWPLLGMFIKICQSFSTYKPKTVWKF